MMDFDNSSISIGRTVLSKCQQGLRGFAEGYNAGFDAGLAKFEFVVAVLFAALLVNVVVNNSWIKEKLGGRFSDLAGTVSFTVGFVASGYMFMQIFLPLIRVSVHG